MTATQRQIETIATEARRAGFADPQYACIQAGIPSRNWKYDLTRSDASALIDQLRDGLTPATDDTPTASYTATAGGMSAVDALTVLGHTASIAVGEDKRQGKVCSIEPSGKDGTPALCMLLTDGRTWRIRISRITAWAMG